MTRQICPQIYQNHPTTSKEMRAKSGQNQKKSKRSLYVRLKSLAFSFLTPYICIVEQQNDQS